MLQRQVLRIRAFILSFPGDLGSRLCCIFFLLRCHYYHRKDGDNYLVYYPEAGFLRGPVIMGKQKARLCLQESWMGG